MKNKTLILNKIKEIEDLIDNIENMMDDIEILAW